MTACLKNYFFIFPLLILLSCNQKTEVVDSQKDNRLSAQNDTTSLVRENADYDTIPFTVSLDNRIHKVYALENGKITKTELNSYRTQTLDSSTLIFSIDNKSAFVLLRSLKLQLMDSLKSLKKYVATIDSVDFLNFRTSIRVDNLLPELISNRFSVHFINWFKNESIYLLFEKIRIKEKSMDNYFYLNQKPIILKNIYVKVGDKVKTGDLLYDFIDNTNNIHYSGILPFSKDELIHVFDKRFENSYQVVGNKLVLTSKNKNQIPDKVTVLLVVKKSLS